MTEIVRGVELGGGDAKMRTSFVTTATAVKPIQLMLKNKVMCDLKG